MPLKPEFVPEKPAKKLECKIMIKGKKLQMSYKNLSLKGFIDEITEVSNGPHPRKFCLLGAGASISSGIKSGQELVTIWDRELLERNEEDHLKWKKDFNITEENKYSHYSRFYEERFRRRPADGYNYLEKLMEHAKPSIGYVMLSHLLKNTRHNVVITTNFDHLTEDAVNYYAQEIPLVIGHESLAHYVSKQITRPTIVKIHRDLLFDPRNRTEELEVLHDNWKKALGEIFAEYHPVFIGYAGNDNSLMDFLLENSRKFLDDEWSFPYWMIYSKDKIDGKVQDFLTNTEGYLIEHNGFDEVMYLLGAAFDYKLPSREDFLSDAEKRYLMLSNAFDRFTETSVGQSGMKQGGEAGDSKVKDSELDQAVEKITSQTEQQDLYRRSALFYNGGQYEESLKIDKQLVALNPANALYHDSLGVTLNEMGKYEEAEREKRKAIELEPLNAEYHASLGITLHEMGRYGEAEIEMQKAIELETSNARYHNCLGATLYEMGRYAESEREFRKAIELKPLQAKYHDSLGAALHEMGRYEEAKRATQKALELEPTNARYHNSLGITLHEMGRYEEAKKEKEKATELDPTNVEYRNSLGFTLQAMGRYEETGEN